MRRRVGFLVAVAFIVLALAAVAEGGGTKLRATLDGAPIDPREAGNYYCHDREYPLIRCFSTSEALERDVLRGDPEHAPTGLPDPSTPASPERPDASAQP